MLSFNLFFKLIRRLDSPKITNPVILFLCPFLLVNCSSNPDAHMNHLANSSSPYLLQHVENPVDWYPWSDEALQKAKDENKLIIISIGYSTCHWCHVMAHESFEDDSVAQFMNENFICIKVDREERPDIDAVYMRAVQMMTGKGGWPLNCVALPDGRPIWGGTYFPKDRWVASLAKILEVRADDPEAVEDYATKLQEGMVATGTLAPTENPIPIDEEFFHVMRHNWSRRWDSIEGGPNKAPKFPLPNNYLFLLRYAIQFDDAKAKDHVKVSLDRMYKGGLYDHVGGGFTRYSTDAQWRIPHFEKMLYDNGQLLELYAEAYKVWKDENFKRILNQTLQFMERELKAENGLYYSALDADSEGEEGKFYVWTNEEVEAILGEEIAAFKEATDWNGRAYWEEDNHVVLISPKSEVPSQWDQWMNALFQAREPRIRPSTDTKILSAWNALAISGICHMSSALQDSSIAELAISKGEVFYTTFVEDDEIWHAANEKGGYISGFSDDYALTIRAFIDLHTVSGNGVWLERARELTEKALVLFGNDESPLLWFTSSEQEELVARNQETQDNVIPSSNGVMVRNLFTLSRIYGIPEWEHRSLEMTQLIMEDAASYPESYSEWAQCALDLHGPYREVSVVGENSNALLAEFNALYLPNAILVGSVQPSPLPPFESRFVEGETRIYVCESGRCQLPVNSIEDALPLIPITQ